MGAWRQLEYASGQRATIVGDDIDSDIGGGQNTGLIGILVKTGKYRKAYANASRVMPDLIIPSVAELPARLPIEIAGS
ncbi:HAD hydrolase-like protein [Methylotuvimicrobium alcaliphilum]|uniref:Uncharacterized protein n=1 Tax=Methylotuvimicrobium alcaliphilum (strain DSM 19304 / NCIMB 14124 / VKM B-2133 / 20Z) TaxID=1091494 RepID=G4STS1_META2|nr:HAD hydrolase-like protein [Methylotuvimicrobium alcaliphilum]CCE21743.1 protein of unknown function [Methylotuvimicrobium alcaliphilum 20Z]